MGYEKLLLYFLGRIFKKGVFESLINISVLKFCDLYLDIRIHKISDTRNFPGIVTGGWFDFKGYNFDENL